MALQFPIIKAVWDRIRAPNRPMDVSANGVIKNDVAGAYHRTVAAALADLGVSVKDFGAVGDGVTDDAAAFNAAIAYGAAGGITVIIPDGIYATTGVITLLSNTKIIGVGKPEITLTNDIVGGWFDGDGISNVHIENLTLNSDKATNLNLHTVININRTNPGTNIAVFNVSIPGATSGGIAIDNSDYVKVNGCDIHDTEAGDCIRLSACNICEIKDNVCDNLANLSLTRRAIQVGSSTNFIISGNNVADVPSNGAYSIDVGGSTDGIISENVCTVCGAGIDLEAGSARIQILGNVFIGLGLVNGNDNGIIAYDETVNDILIDGNTINNFYRGIQLEGSTDITIKNNVIADAVSAAITVIDEGANVADRILIIGNIIRDASAEGGGLAPSISAKFATGVISLNNISGANHSYAIADNAANVNVQMFGNVMSLGTSGATMSLSQVYRIIDTQGRQIWAGAGSPENNVAAPPGSLYMNESGGAGVSLYVKEAGVGNVGWVGK